MDAKSKIDAIKALLGIKFEAAAPAGEETEAPGTKNPKNEITLKDGTIARYEGDLAIGGELYVVTPEGETMAPDGNYEMEDGTVITVASGTISAVMPPAESAAHEQGMQAQFIKVEDAEAHLMKFATGTIEEQVAALVQVVKFMFTDMYSWQLQAKQKETEMQSVTALVSGFRKEMDATKEAFMKTVELVETFNNTPKVDTPAPIDAMFKKQDPTYKLQAMAEALKSFKK